MSSNDNASLCAFTYSDGRQCRMLRSSRKSQFCFHHERKLRHLRETDYTAAEICDPLSHDFVPATALTHSLTRAMRAVAEGRLDPKCATALARIASTLLKSINESSKEFQECYKDRFWRQLIYSHHTNLPVFETDEEEDDKENEAEAADLENTNHSPLPETAAEFAEKVGV